jgi:uncharacterized protein YbjT (DUF2867 family)
MRVLVMGATGTVGNLLVGQLRDAGHQVRALTRNASKANFPNGVEVYEGDLTRPDSVAGAFEGVEAVHFINFDGGDYSSLEGGAELVRLAEEAGVKRATVLGAGEDGSLEQALRGSGIVWTVLMPVEFMNNAFDCAEAIRNDGVVRQGYANRRSAMVHEADIAAVAATALTQEGHGGKWYTITGPEVLTPVQMVAAISARIGRPIEFVELTDAESRAAWEAQGFPEETIAFFEWVHGNTPKAGYTVLPTVEQVTGRPARTFAQWIDEHAAVFVGR